MHHLRSQPNFTPNLHNIPLKVSKRGPWDKLTFGSLLKLFLQPVAKQHPASLVAT